jgi:hypothetical protein
MRSTGFGAVRAKVVALVAAAAVVGMASIAAAAPGDPVVGDPVAEPAPPEVEPDDETTDGTDDSTDDTADDAVDEPVAEDVGEDDGTEEPAPDDPDGCLTHGQRVSEIARTTPPGPEHGKVVSAAARSHEGECGDESEPPEEPVEPEPTAGEAVPEPEPTVSEAVAPAIPGHAKGGPPAHAQAGGRGKP